MALQVYVNSNGGTITQLNDGSPFRLESAEGLSGSDVIRYEQRGPYQSGVSDLGFRLRARVVTLHLLFYASSASQLDTYRSTLNAAFKPLDSTSIFLSVQRDDSEIRTLTCHTVGEIEISLVPENYPGHLHRATVNLRAAGSLWKANDVTVGTIAFASTIGSWWLAGGAIGSANVLYHNENVGPQQFVNMTFGTVTGDWSVAVTTAKDTASPGSPHMVWMDGLNGSASFWRDSSGSFNFQDYELSLLKVAWPGTTGYNYHVVESRSGTQYWRYWNSGTLTQWANNSVLGSVAVGTDVSLVGAHGSVPIQEWAWRGHRTESGSVWAPAIHKAAIYGTVTTAQLQALGPYMLDAFSGSVSVVNDGDVYAYPIMTLRGPIVDPVIVNSTIAATVDLTGISLGSADLMTIDLRDGNKQIYNASGSSLLGSATTLPVALASFYLAPHPIAAGGTNTILLTNGSVGSASLLTVQIQNQYMSF